MKSVDAAKLIAIRGEDAVHRNKPLAALIAWGVLVSCSWAYELPIDSPNLLPNPSFEKSEERGVAGWVTRAWQGDEAVCWSVTSPGRDGGQCVSIASKEGGDAAWSTTVAVQPNTFYRLSGWIRTDGVKGAVGALLNIQNMQHVRTEPVTGTADWTHVSTIFRTMEETRVEINCLFGGWGKSTGQAWYDDVCLTPLPESSRQTEAFVTIRTDAPTVRYSPMLFGGFIEHFHRQIYGGLYEPESPLSNASGFRQDVIQAMKELKLSVVRWPGGCFASGYHWQDGVGRQRTGVEDPVWGVTDPNTFGTDEFIAWCRDVGCEPYICTNAGNGTPEEMRAWVEYCNGLEGDHARLRRESGRERPFGVRFWSIGNENWGGHEIGSKTPAEWGPLVRQSAELMRAADSEITLIAAATPNRAWTLPLLATAGNDLDYVAVHQYWLPCWQKNVTPDYLSCMMLCDGPEQTIRRVIEVLEEAGYRGRIKIAFDEWNLRGWHHPGFPRKTPVTAEDEQAHDFIARRELNADASQYTMADALFAASFLNACLRHADDVGMANIAPIVNTRGPLYVHPRGVVRRTTFHALAMYANDLQPLVGQLEIEAGMLVQRHRFVPVLDAIATTDEGRDDWSIALINRHPTDELTCCVRMDDTPISGSFSATVLAGDSPDAYNDVEHPNRVTREDRQMVFDQGCVRLPPHSLTVVKTTRAIVMGRPAE